MECREPREPRGLASLATFPTRLRDRPRLARDKTLGSEASPGTSAVPPRRRRGPAPRSGFVRGVITANPFMRAKPATTARVPRRERRAAVLPGRGRRLFVSCGRPPRKKRGTSRRGSAVPEPIGVVSESVVLTEGARPVLSARRRRRRRSAASRPGRAAGGAAGGSQNGAAGSTPARPDEVGDANAFRRPPNSEAPRRRRLDGDGSRDPRREPRLRARRRFLALRASPGAARSEPRPAASATRTPTRARAGNGSAPRRTKIRLRFSTRATALTIRIVTPRSALAPEASRTRKPRRRNARDSRARASRLPAARANRNRDRFHSTPARSRTKPRSRLAPAYPEGTS